MKLITGKHFYCVCVCVCMLVYLLDNILPARHGVNSILELELMVNSNSGIDYLKENGIEIFELELKFPTKQLNPQINLPFNSEIFLP